MNRSALSMLVVRCCILEGATLGEKPVAAEFRWDRVNSTAFRLTWDVQRMTDRGVKRIEVLYTQTENLDKVKSRLVDVKKGGVLIGWLLPDTPYSLEAIALGAGGIVLTQTDLLRTLPTGEFFSDCIRRALPCMHASSSPSMP
ncbi:hypothetical protein TSMEX_011356 [Taenia solium]|eukprot:TsM_001215100 transcript=TsM_001215100 gene=TsM_001215100